MGTFCLRSRRSDSESLSGPPPDKGTEAGAFGRPRGLTARLRACSGGEAPAWVVGAVSWGLAAGPWSAQGQRGGCGSPPGADRHVRGRRWGSLSSQASSGSAVGLLARGGCCAGAGRPPRPEVPVGLLCRSGRPRSRAERADRLVVSLPGSSRSAAERAPERRAAHGGRPSQPEEGRGRSLLILQEEVLIHDGKFCRLT